MAKPRVYTVTKVVRNPRLFETAIPFDITRNGVIIATVVSPKGEWYECENCGENTQNVIDFKDEDGVWQKLILCDKCADELL